jgi:hypothetical protein
MLKNNLEEILLETFLLHKCNWTELQHSEINAEILLVSTKRSPEEDPVQG